MMPQASWTAWARALHAGQWLSFDVPPVAAAVLAVGAQFSDSKFSVQIRNAIAGGRDNPSLMPPALQPPPPQQQPPPPPQQQHVAAAVQNANAIATAVNVFVTPIDGAYGTGLDLNNVIMFGSVAVSTSIAQLIALAADAFQVPACDLALVFESAAIAGSSTLQAILPAGARKVSVGVRMNLRPLKVVFKQMLSADKTETLFFSREHAVLYSTVRAHVARRCKVNDASTIKLDVNGAAIATASLEAEVALEADDVLAVTLPEPASV
jgi:hypothetical protein